MRILHIGKYFAPHKGGMETFLRDLMLEQAKNGLEVAALVHSSERTFKTRAEACHIDNTELEITRVARWGTLSFAPISPTFYAAARATINRFMPDVIHIHMPNASGLWLLILKEARRVPWVIHWQSDVVTSRHKRILRWLYPIYRIPEQALLRQAKHIIATSPPYLSTSEPLKQHRAKCSVVPLAIQQPKTLVDPAPAPTSGLAVTHDKLKVLTVCRLTYYKGVQYLLEAIAKTTNATLTLIGDGEERKSLLLLAQQLGIEDRCNFIFNCSEDDLAGHYRTHDIFCLPSIERTEAFGVVLLEAMQMGLPCLVSDVPGSGMAWVVDAPHAGYTIPPADAGAMAKVLADIHNDRAKLEALRANAISRYRQQFSMALCQSEISAIYLNAVKP